MAIGVPESEVFAAADAVLARGERPTVERVRLEMGRGSPARVGQLLELWWERLAQRLKGQVLLPDLPGETAQAFAEVWRLAVMQADATAREALTDEQNALFAAQTSLTQERKLWELALAEAQAQVAESATKLAQAELQFNERQTLIVQLTTQVADLRQESDRQQVQLEQQRADMDALKSEREAAQAHIRAVENRGHQQIDQARQENKVLQQRLEWEHREYAKQIAEFTAQRDALQAAVRTAEQAAAHRAGQVAALEATVNQWRSTHATRPKRAPGKTSAVPTAKPRTQRKKVGP